MTPVSFFTPILLDQLELPDPTGKQRGLEWVDGGRKQKVVEWVDGYFSLGEKVAAVVPYKKASQGSILTEARLRPQSLLAKTIKVVTYCTGVVPLIVLVAKGIFRYHYKFDIKPSVIEETVQRLWPQNSHFTVKDVVALGNRRLKLHCKRDAMELTGWCFSEPFPLRAINRLLDIPLNTKTAFLCKWRKKYLSLYEEKINCLIRFPFSWHLPTPEFMVDVARNTHFSVFGGDCERDPIPLPQIDVDGWDLSEEFKKHVFYTLEDEGRVCGLLVAHYRKHLLDYIRSIKT